MILRNDDIVVKSINVTSPSVFSGDVAFSGDITLDEITCRNADVTGIATVRTDLYVGGNFKMQVVTLEIQDNYYHQLEVELILMQRTTSCSSINVGTNNKSL